MRAGRVAGRADEADPLARRDERARLDARVAEGEVAVDPRRGRRASGSIDAGAADAVVDEREHDGVREREHRCAGRGGDVRRGVVVVVVADGDDAGPPPTGKT